MKNIFIILAACLMAAAGCSKTEDTPTAASKAGQPLQFTHRVQANKVLELGGGAALSRSTDPELDYTYLPEGTNVKIYAVADNSTAQSAYYVANDYGTLALKDTENNEAIKYPAIGGLKIYAEARPEDTFHSAMSNENNLIFGWGDHFLPNEQNPSETTLSDYDLKYCYGADADATAASTSLTFKHLFSRVEIIVIDKTGTLSGSGTAKLTLEKYNTCTIIEDEDVLSFTSTSGPAAENDYSARYNISTDEDNPSLSTMLVYPQTITANTEFIEIGGKKYSHDEDFTFLPGTTHRLTFTYVNGGLELAPMVNDWTDGGGQESDINPTN